MEVFEITNEAANDVKTGKKSYFTKEGFKRAILLLCALMILGIIQTIIQKLSDANVNKLFGTLLTEMKSFKMHKNISTIWKKYTKCWLEFM